MAKLTDVCDFQGGSQPPKEEWSFEEQDGYIRMLQIRDFTQSERVTPEYIKISGTTKICEADDILVARYGASLGKILTGLAGAYNVAIMRTIPNETVLTKKYLYYYLKSPYFQTSILNVGSRAAQAGFNKEDLSKLDINCPSFEEQDNIVHVLQKVENVIKNREIELDKLDDLIKARFVEMFGHQSHNEKRLSYMTIDDVAEIYLGITHTPEYVDEGVTFISAKNTSGDFLDLTDVKYISREEFSSAPNGSKPKKNDVLFSRVGSNLGHPVILEDDIELCTFVSLGFLRTKGKVTSNYLKHWMRDDYFPLQVAEHVKGGGQPNLNTGWLKQFKIIVPDLDAQYKFDAFCKQVDKSKVAVQKALNEKQQLFNSLMQEYFG